MDYSGNMSLMHARSILAKSSTDEGGRLPGQFESSACIKHLSRRVILIDAIEGYHVVGGLLDDVMNSIYLGSNFNLFDW